MSENVELVRRTFEAMSAWDVDALLRLYDAEGEFLPLTGTGWRAADTGATRAYARTSPRPEISGM